CIRSEAVRAAIVATALHWYPCLHAIEAARGEVVVVFLEVEAREHATLTVPCLLDEFGKCTVAIGADDQAYMPGVRQQLRAQALRHAASNTNHASGLHVPTQFTQPANHALFGVISYCTRIHQNHVCAGW